MDVARAAGVSQPTVSRVFTPGMKVSADLADRVRQAARELGYRPNTLARSLITGQSKTIGLVVAYLDNPFYAEALDKLSRVLRERGYNIMIFMAANHAADADALVHDLLDHQVDGIIMASVGMSSEITDRLANEGVPMVLINRGQDGGQFNSVTSANVAGARKVAEFLVAAGHQRIAHISGWQGSSTGRDRNKGYAAGLAQAGLSPVAVIDGLYSRDAAAAAARSLFSGGIAPDAIFVGNDHMAFAVLEVLRLELGLSVPDDVSVVGYDDVAMASWPSFQLTTLRQPANQMVAATVDRLLHLLRHADTTPHQIEIDGPLIIRKTARIPKGWTP